MDAANTLSLIHPGIIEHLRSNWDYVHCFQIWNSLQLKANLKSRKMMRFMTIGQIAAASGIAASAIRYYESVGVLPTPKRRNGRRVYDEAVLDLLRAIQVAKAAGFSVKELRALFRGFAKGASLSKMWKTLARKKLDELDAMIERANAMKDLLRKGLKCDCLTPSDCRILSHSEMSIRQDGP